jgi:ribosomal protein L35AE/L33A
MSAIQMTALSQVVLSLWALFAVGVGLRFWICDRRSREKFAAFLAHEYAFPMKIEWAYWWETPFGSKAMKSLTYRADVTTPNRAEGIVWMRFEHTLLGAILGSETKITHVHSNAR